MKDRMKVVHNPLSPPHPLTPSHFTPSPLPEPPLTLLSPPAAWAYPQESDYDDYEYEEEVEEYGDVPEFAFESQNLVAKVGETVNIPCQITENSKCRREFSWAWVDFQMISGAG